MHYSHMRLEPPSGTLQLLPPSCVAVCAGCQTRHFWLLGTALLIIIRMVLSQAAAGRWGHSR